MGFRLHNVIKYVKEYADGDYFNWQTEEFENTLSAYECNSYTVHNDDTLDIRIEIDGDAWNKFLTDFKADKGAKSEMKNYTFEEQLEIFEGYKICDDGWLRLEWW